MGLYYNIKDVLKKGDVPKDVSLKKDAQKKKNIQKDVPKQNDGQKRTIPKKDRSARRAVPKQTENHEKDMVTNKIKPKQDNRRGKKNKSSLERV